MSRRVEVLGGPRAGRTPCAGSGAGAVTARKLTLFVAGESTSSHRARENLARLQAHDLPADWTIEVVDVLVDPGRAETSRILATPTLSLDDPARPRRIVGDLSERTRILEFLGIETRSETP